MTVTPLDPFRLDGQTVLISGAGGGIGSALVERFTMAGAKVFGADRDAAALAHLALAGQVTFDLADLRATEATMETFLATSGVPNIVVSNAGYTRAETLEDVDVATWESELAINLNGAYAMLRPIVAAMSKRRSGSIVLVSSVNGLMHFGNPAYSAAKAGLIAYAKAIAVERGRDGIRANVVAPGSVRTPAWDHRLAANPSLLSKVTPLYPLGRLVSPTEVANAVLFLASPAAAGITGTVLPVDAGLTAGNLRFVDDVLRAGR
jgi:NAD(P)-dependent dehydrogenase (short-subunit alcohol dehydrogenase family)